MPKVVCFGEIMLRLSSPGYQRLVQADCFDVTYGGGEANVAVSLANFGADSYFVTKVPDSPLGQSAINHMRRYGVHTDFVKRGGDRLGIYFLENGVSQRPSLVIYDRANSAIAVARPEDFNWPEIFAGAAWFHFTGITPAISESLAEITLSAVTTARKMGLTVSCDLNYRKKLWTPEKANQTMLKFARQIDVCIANEEDAEKVFGIKAADTDILAGTLSEAGYRDVARQLVGRFGFKMAAITLRESRSASNNGWSGMLYDGNEFFFSRKYDINIVDRVGSGDSFSGGLIHALLSGRKPGDALEFAVAASCLKHTIAGDFNAVTAVEVDNLARGDGSGRVSR